MEPRWIPPPDAEAYASCPVFNMYPSHKMHAPVLGYNTDAGTAAGSGSPITSEAFWRRSKTPV